MFLKKFFLVLALPLWLAAAEGEEYCSTLPRHYRNINPAL